MNRPAAGGDPIRVEIGTAPFCPRCGSKSASEQRDSRDGTLVRQCWGCGHWWRFGPTGDLLEHGEQPA